MWLFLKIDGSLFLENKQVDTVTFKKHFFERPLTSLKKTMYTYITIYKINLTRWSREVDDRIRDGS